MTEVRDSCDGRFLGVVTAEVPPTQRDLVLAVKPDRVLAMKLLSPVTTVSLETVRLERARWSEHGVVTDVWRLSGKFEEQFRRAHHVMPVGMTERTWWGAMLDKAETLYKLRMWLEFLRLGAGCTIN